MICQQLGLNEEKNTPKWQDIKIIIKGVDYDIRTALCRKHYSSRHI